MTEIEPEKRSRSVSLKIWLRPIAFILALLILWQIAVSRHPDQLLPGPLAVIKGIVELLQHGLLLKYVVASLFRVTWGFALAAVLAIPLGLTIGWYRRYQEGADIAAVTDSQIEKYNQAWKAAGRD